jgi:hypothetical protein
VCHYVTQNELTRTDGTSPYVPEQVPVDASMIAVDTFDLGAPDGDGLLEHVARAEVLLQ